MKKTLLYDFQKIITDTFGNQIDDDVRLALSHILVVGEFQIYTEHSEDGQMKLMFSSTLAGVIMNDTLRSNDGVNQHMRYKHIDNIYELPVEYQSTIDMVRQKLLDHPSVIEINLMDFEGVVKRYDFMWTSDKDDHWLVEHPNGQHSIFRLSIKSDLIIEDDVIYESLIQKMLAGGVKVVSIEELHRYLNSFVAPGVIYLPPKENDI